MPHVPMATSQVVGTQQQFQTGMMGTPMPAVSQSVASSQPQPVPGLSGSLSSISVHSCPQQSQSRIEEIKKVFSLFICCCFFLQNVV